ncbi:MAG: 7-cyano-7-deazaguanine synthase QueC [Candidatus Omnitrophica bacterium]|nr:7-cyano-7-deazaguanine synthase QueC [Candidatus Omnitrophota bacterium]
MRRKAVVLLSGGLDSAVALYYARKRGYECYCLIFDYGQRHKKELILARKISEASGSKLKIIRLNLPWKGSSLLDRTKGLPQNRTIREIKKGIPPTYVPARNTIFLSIASSFAEAIGAHDIFIGAHFEDSSGYPDCRKEYLEAFQRVIKIGTRAGLENRLRVRYPLISKTKKEIIELGNALGVPFQSTWSCYKGAAEPCMKCDSCILRAKGFKEAGIKDPLLIGR